MLAGIAVEQSKPGRLEKFAVIVLLLVSTGAFMNLGLEDSAGQPDLGVRILWYLCYLLMVGLFLWNCNERKRRLLSLTPLLAIIAFASLSTFWSQDPAQTLRHSADLLLATLFGVYFAARYELKEQLKLLMWVFAVCVFFSFVFGFFGIGTAVDADKNVEGWYGIFIQKNNLGRTMVLSALVFFFGGVSNPRNRTSAWVGALASLVLILLSRSLTSILVVPAVALMVLYLRWALQKTRLQLVAGILLLLVFGSTASYYVITHLEGATNLVGRDPTLTGRLDIWILCVVMALRQPWLGYGYEAFWLPDKWYVERAWKILGWNVPSAHNGFLQLWLELGIVGGGLFLLVFSYYFAKALRSLRRDFRPGAAWPIAFLLFLLFTNLTEPIFLGSNSIFFILFVTAACWLVQGNASDRPAASSNRMVI